MSLTYFPFLSFYFFIFFFHTYIYNQFEQNLIFFYDTKIHNFI